MKTDKKRLVGVEWVAERLELGRSTVYRMAASGEIPAVRLGNSVRFDREQVELWLQHEMDKAMEERE